MAVADAVAEPADLEELEVVGGAVDLFPRRLPNLAHFPHWRYFSLPATEKRGKLGTFSYARSEVIRVCACACACVGDLAHGNAAGE